MDILTKQNTSLYVVDILEEKGLLMLQGQQTPSWKLSWIAYFDVYLLDVEALVDYIDSMFN